MPLYVYECADCEIEVDELRPADKADALVECPICHGLCTRTFSAFAIGRHAAAPEPTPVYGRVPASYHGVGCGCCVPRRR